MNKSFQINIPISKIDEEQRTVTGVATSEALDSQGDIVDYEASKKAFSEWKEIGNIREMHGETAIGKGIDVQFDDDSKQIIVTSKISESADGENAWIKIKEEILTGYSIGGRVFEVIKDKAVEGANRVVDYALSELSLVDNPACPDAKLLMVKSVDGKLSTTGVIQKSVWDAGVAIALASELAYLIIQERYDDNTDESQIADLVEAFDRLRAFASKEVSEGDDYVLESIEVVELANKAINLRKDKMGKNKVEKANVVGGEERDAEAEVVTTQEEAGRPANDTEERADQAGVEVSTGTEEVTVPTEGEEAETTEEEVVEYKKPKNTETVKETEVEADKKPEDTEEEDEDEKSKKADSIADLAKNVETLLAKIADDNKSDAKLQKAVGGLQKSVDKVAETMSKLEDRVKAIEDQPAPTRGQRFAVVNKGDEPSEVSSDLQALYKRQDELTENPSLAKEGEHAELALSIRKALNAQNK